MVFLNPWVSSMKDWHVFCIGLNFLLNSSLAWCDCHTNNDIKHDKLKSNFSQSREFLSRGDKRILNLGRIG